MEEGRKIPVQVVGPIVGENEELDPEELARSLNLAINRVPREALPSSLPPRRGSEGSNRSSRNGSSNRASLVVTHDDGSTEDVETEVTCLGLSMDSSWGAPGARGGLTIQELGGEEISLNSFLSDISAEPIYADADPIYDIVGEVDEEDSGTSTPELLLPPCQVEAEIHPCSDRQTLDLSEKNNSVQIVTKPSASPSSSPFPVGTPDVLETRTPSCPPMSGEKKVGSEKEDASPTTLAPTSTESSQPSENDNSEERRERLPPTPSPTPPSLLSTPSASPLRASSPSINLFSTPIPITRNSNPSPTPPLVTPNTNSTSSVTKSPTGHSPNPRSRPSSPPPPRPSSPPPPLPPSHSPPPDKSPVASPQSFASSAPQHSQGMEKPERTVVRRVSVEKDVRREEIVIEEKVQHNVSGPSEMTVGQSESAESAAKVVQVPIELGGGCEAAHPKSRHSKASLEKRRQVHNAGGGEEKQTGEPGTSETISRAAVDESCKPKKMSEPRKKEETQTENRRSGGGSVPVRIIPISLPDGRVIERKSTEQTSIDIEFTECLNTSFAKSSTGEKMKAGGVNAQQTTESGNQSKSEERKREGDANNNNEENLRKWKKDLDSACQGGEQLSGGDEARRWGGCEGVTERIIPIAHANKGNAPVTDTAKGGKVEPRSRVVPIVLAGREESGEQTERGEDSQTGGTQSGGEKGGPAAGSSIGQRTKEVATPLLSTGRGGGERPSSPVTKEQGARMSPLPKEQARVTFCTTPTSPTPNSSSKPPLQGAARAVPILRNSESSSNGGARMRNKSESSKLGDQEDLKRLTAELEESHNRLQAQARELAGRNGKLFRTETRSRSVEADRRETGQGRQRYPGLKRERSLQDIDKDIETIWRELQELDKLPADGPSSSTAPPTLSEQHLVSPPWRRPAGATSVPPHQPPHHYSFVPRTAETRPGAITPTYVSPSPRTARAAFLAQTTTASNASTVTRGRPSKTGSQILETDFPSESSGKPKSSPAAGQTPKVPSSQSNGNSASQGLNNGTFQPSSATSPVYSSTSKTASFSSSTVKERSSSQTRGVEGLKSCLKSESRSSSASRSSTGLLRSESPAAGRESPAKQGVNFRAQPNVKTYEKEQEEEEERVINRVDSSTDPPTFDWVEFSSSEGQTKGKIQTNGGTKEVKEESKKVERIVPIIFNGREEGRSRSRERAPNPFLSGSKGSEGLKSKEEKERVSNGTSSSPTKIAPLATAETDKTESACYACDVCTQTEVPSKKGCHVM